MEITDLLLDGQAGTRNELLKEGMQLTLHIPSFHDPKEWLYKPFQSIVIYNWKEECNYQALEMYIRFEFKTMNYFAIEGNSSIALISNTDENYSILISKQTIDMLLEKSIYCHRPFILCLKESITKISK